MSTETVIEIIASVLGICLVIAIVIGLFAYVVTPVFKGIGRAIVHVFTFIANEIGDALRLVGGTVTAIVFIPLTLISVLIGRWSRAAHYGRAISSEVSALGSCFYRLAIGNPARLFCLTALTDGLERRLPEVMAQAPGPDRPSHKRLGQFDGYKIVGSLPGGGSGGKLFIAEPDDLKLAAFTRQGITDASRVVIKAFSLSDGSSLPQIVRESRALEAAKKLGLVLDHELTNERFYYVTRFVPGESLGLVTQRLHAQTGGSGLNRAHFATVMNLAGDLLQTLCRYHEGGLWHKDVKPDNIIVDGRHQPSAHLVDFGLVTPLRSGMTLTTHGTEYFRDPELVRLALKGVKVHQVDGAKFDLYAAGAVLFSMIENSFPAHGGLSQVTKPCPDALRWIVRRAMTDYDKRYTSAAAMLADLEVVRRAADPFAVKPAELPSVRAGADEADQSEQIAAGPSDSPSVYAGTWRFPNGGLAGVSVGIGAESARLAKQAAADADFAMRGALSPIPPAPPYAPAPPHAANRPRLRVTNWWSGRYESDTGPVVVPAALAEAPVARAAMTPMPRVHAAPADEPRRSAVEQLSAARGRARAARERAGQRSKARRTAGALGRSNSSGGLAVAMLLAVLVPAGAIALLLKSRESSPEPSFAAFAIDLSDESATPPPMAGSPTSLPAAPGFRFKGFDNQPPLPPSPPVALARGAAERGVGTDDLSPDEIRRAARVIETLVREGALLLPEPLAAKIRHAGTSSEPSDRADSTGHRLMTLLQSASKLHAAGEAIEAAAESPHDSPIEADTEPALERETDLDNLQGVGVLFISDLAPPLNAHTEARLSQYASRLGRAGLVPIGAFPGNRATGERLEQQQALAIELRSRVGLEPVTSPSAAQTIATWIDDFSDDVSGVIWIVPGAQASQDGIYLFGPHSAFSPDDDGDPRILETWKAIQAALKPVNNAPQTDRKSRR